MKFKSVEHAIEHAADAIGRLGDEIKKRKQEYRECLEKWEAAGSPEHYSGILTPPTLKDHVDYTERKVRELILKRRIIFNDFIALATQAFAARAELEYGLSEKEANKVAKVVVDRLLEDEK